MTTIQFPGAPGYEKHMVIQTANHQIIDCLRSPRSSRRLHTYVKLK